MRLELHETWCRHLAWHIGTHRESGETQKTCEQQINKMLTESGKRQWSSENCRATVHSTVQHSPIRLTDEKCEQNCRATVHSTVQHSPIRLTDEKCEQNCRATVHSTVQQSPVRLRRKVWAKLQSHSPQHCAAQPYTADRRKVWAKLQSLSPQHYATQRIDGWQTKSVRKTAKNTMFDHKRGQDILKELQTHSQFWYNSTSITTSWYSMLTECT